MLIFWLFFILADKISRFAKFWLLIQNLNSVAVWEILHLNYRYDFVRFSRNFCQNVWTSSICTHVKTNVFWISTVVIQHERHECRFITSIREYPPYWKFRLAYFSLRIHATENCMWIISSRAFLQRVGGKYGYEDLTWIQLNLFSKFVLETEKI